MCVGATPQMRPASGNVVSRDRGAPSMEPEPKGILRLRIALSVLLVLQVVATWAPGPKLWGVNHLAYIQLPLTARLAWPALGLLLLWSPLPLRLGRLTLRSSRTEGGLLLRQALCAPCVGLLLWVFRTRTRFLGDGELLGELVSRGVKDHGFDFMTYHIHATLYQLLQLHGEQQAVALFAIISVLSGVVYVAVAVWGMRALYGRSPLGMLGLGLLTLGPSMLLFCGYVECYGPLAVALLWFGIALVRYYRGHCTFLSVGLAFSVAVFLHPNALFLTPALLGLGLYPRDRLTWSARVARLTILLLFPVGALTVGTLVLLLRGCGFSLAKALSDGGGLLLPLTGEASLSSLYHWKDLLNLLLLLAPLHLALAVAAPCGRAQRIWSSNEAKVLLLGIAGLGAIAAGVNMRIGMVRDWDILAPHVAVVSLAALILVSKRVDAAAYRRAAGLVTIAAIFLLVPWIAMNASPDSTLERFRSVTGDLGAYAKAYAYEEIARFERDHGDVEAALDAYGMSIAAAPTNPRLRLARTDLMFRTGRGTQAIEELEVCVQDNPTYVPALRALALMHVQAGSPERALELARALRRLTTESVEDANTRGQAAERLGLWEEALEAYGWALDRAPLRADIAQHLIAAMFHIEGIAATQAYFRAVLDAQPTSATRIYLALALWLPLRGHPELLTSPSALANLREANELLVSVPVRDREQARLRNMEAEVSAALGLKP